MESWQGKVAWQDGRKKVLWSISAKKADRTSDPKKELNS